MTNSMPAWLRAQLVEKGYLSESGLGRIARLHCHHPCGLPTLAGLDSQMAALDAYVDPAELSAFGEAAALLDGRRTYDYNITHRHLSRRDQWRITGRPAGGSQATVFAQHVCEHPIPAEWCVPPQPHKPAARQPQSKEIPF